MVPVLLWRERLKNKSNHIMPGNRTSTAAMFKAGNYKKQRMLTIHDCSRSSVMMISNRQILASQGYFALYSTDQTLGTQSYYIYRNVEVQ